jgi:hypothetical protein
MIDHAHELDHLILDNRPEITTRRAQGPSPGQTPDCGKARQDDLRMRRQDPKLASLQELVSSINI